MTSIMVMLSDTVMSVFRNYLFVTCLFRSPRIASTDQFGSSMVGWIEARCSIGSRGV